MDILPYEERIQRPEMEYYRQVYAGSKKWDGKEDITDKRVVVYMEQGYGDQIQFLRFLRYLKKKTANIVLHAPAALKRLVEHMGYQFADKDEPTLPDHDFHIMSLSLPFVLHCAIPLEPYIHVEEKFDLPPGLN